MTGIMLAPIRARVVPALDTSALDLIADGNGTVTAQVVFYTDGTIANNSRAGGGRLNTLMTPNPAYWWTGGTPPATWMSYTSTGGGTITGGLAAGTRYQLNVNRTLGISRAIVNAADRNFTLSFYDAASGGNLLGTKTYTVTAERL